MSPRLSPYLVVFTGVLTGVGVILTIRYTIQYHERPITDQKRYSIRQRRRRQRRRQQQQQQQTEEHDDWLLPLHLDTDNDEEEGQLRSGDTDNEELGQDDDEDEEEETGVTTTVSGHNNNPGTYPNAHTDRLLSLFTEWQDEDEDGDNKNLLQLLHAISENQARKEGYIHRGITCNKCAVSPIRGIRYKCANCVDFDLCDMCESSSHQHTQTHVFLKIRIPIPPLANPRSALLPPFYPGKNDRLTLSSDQARTLAAQSHFDHVELEALFAQYRSLSVIEGGGINKTTFEQCLGPLGMEKNLITERIFSFFDRDRDGVIMFPELVGGLSVLCKGNLDEKIEYAFNGYDLDEDGYISRDELYWMFKSYFYLSMELVRDVVSAMEDEMLDQYDFPAGQPVSAAFNVPIPSTSTSTTEEDEDEDEEEETSRTGDMTTATATATAATSHNKNDTSLEEKRQVFVEDQQGWEEKFPIMETMAQDAIHEMVNKTFRNMVTKREGHISFDEFKQCVQTDSSIVSWFEALGTVF
ncbi:hypothetical protein BC941DRAFT_150290 [Chlamydoabsidia padenii]|nr:hypothetical protein BC941DRAFT_150290 [Chlamydoabsidia padenii]